MEKLIMEDSFQDYKVLLTYNKETKLYHVTLTHNEKVLEKCTGYTTLEKAEVLFKLTLEGLY